jgi:hypothetical protein
MGRHECSLEETLLRLLSLCLVFSEGKILGEDESRILIWKSILVQILVRKGCGE